MGVLPLKVAAMSQAYLSLEAELHDAFWTAEDDGSELRLMADFLKKFPGSVLEIGAGSGRLMFPLIQQGHAVEGLELSEDMIALGKISATQLGISPALYLGDMETWDDGRKFSALLAPAFTLQLASDPEAALRHWHGLLEPHGGLYLTVFMPYAELLGDLPENEWYADHEATLEDGRVGKLETQHRLDHERQLVHRQHRYTLSGSPPQSHESQQTIRWIEHGEMMALLEKCGFRVDRCYLDFDPARVTTDTDQEDFDGILTYEATRVNG
jgi:SAM-dependent methyltransferase